MYLGADSDEQDLLDATGVPVAVIGAVDSNFGTPPSINLALVDANTGQILTVAQPIKDQTTPSWVIPAAILGLLLVVGRNWVFSKRK